MTKLQGIVYETITRSLQGRVFVWTKTVRVFTDGGSPIFRWWPSVRIHAYAPYWGLRGWILTWLGRQMFLTVGNDRHNLYRETNRQRGLL
jgi:hypothetical protein